MADRRLRIVSDCGHCRTQAEHPGDLGPIVRSRGVGGGQVTLPTLLKGVSPRGRDGVDGYEWVSGIPVPKDGKMPTPEHWMGAKSSCTRARQLLESKFTPRRPDKGFPRDCSYGAVPGGKRYECARCLERFQLGPKQTPLLAPNTSDDSYHCTADASRWPELFGVPLAEDSEVGRSEYPCSWLRAVQRYAGDAGRPFHSPPRSSTSTAMKWSTSSCARTLRRSRSPRFCSP